MFWDYPKALECKQCAGQHSCFLVFSRERFVEVTKSLGPEASLAQLAEELDVSEEAVLVAKDAQPKAPVPKVPWEPKPVDPHEFDDWDKDLAFEVPEIPSIPENVLDVTPPETPENVLDVSPLETPENVLDVTPSETPENVLDKSEDPEPLNLADTDETGNEALNEIQPNASVEADMPKKRVKKKVVAKKAPPKKKAASKKVGGKKAVTRRQTKKAAIEEPLNPPLAEPAQTATGSGETKAQGKNAKRAKGPADPKTPKPHRKDGVLKDIPWGTHTWTKRYLKERRHPLIKQLRPGMKLQRKYKKEIHEVTVLKKFYRYKGEEYPTLYAVTKAITGTKASPRQLTREGDRPPGTREMCQWSAQRFFSLKALFKQS
jgi:hypothetical protein